MIDINNTSSNDYCLCTDCEFAGLECCHKYTMIPNGIYYCLKKDVAVEHVGVCRDYVTRKI